MQLSIAKAPSRFEFKAVVKSEVSEYFQDMMDSYAEALEEEFEILYDEYDMYNAYEEGREPFDKYEEDYHDPYEYMYDDPTWNWD